MQRWKRRSLNSSFQGWIDKGASYGKKKTSNACEYEDRRLGVDPGRSTTYFIITTEFLNLNVSLLGSYHISSTTFKFLVFFSPPGHHGLVNHMHLCLTYSEDLVGHLSENNSGNPIIFLNRFKCPYLWYGLNYLGIKCTCVIIFKGRGKHTHVQGHQAIVRLLTYGIGPNIRVESRGQSFKC